MATRKPTTKKAKTTARTTTKKKVSAAKPAATRRPAAKTARKPAPRPAHRKAKAPTAGPARPEHFELDEPTSERDEVFEIFRTYDRDGSGSISRDEFARLVEALGMAIDDEELEIALDIVDANHSGRISWDEFKAWWLDR